MPAGLRYLIEKSCNPDPSKRHNSIDELNVDLKNAFNIILNRGSIETELINIISSFNHMLATTNKYDQNVIFKIGELFTTLPVERAQIFLDKLNSKFYSIIGLPKFENSAKNIWDVYKEVAIQGNHGFGYAEVIANNVNAFHSNCKNAKLFATALETGIISAIKQNRFNAMAKMQSIIISIDDDAYANEVVPLILEYSNSFLKEIEPEQCKSSIIYQTIKSISTQ